MKNLIFLSAIILFVSCKQEPQKPLKYADVDTSSNEVVHLTDGDDTYYTLTELIDENKGKIIYLNFFHSFVPKEIMRATEALEKSMDSTEFIILNISTEAAMDPFQNHLKITTLKHNYITRNFPEATFYQTHKIQAIPRYMIYDRSGKLIDDYALGTDDERLQPILEALINQQ
ncbi:TlpA family protein disulfide reductase [Nonlabens antarcticus]|uniref:TlpA family protein disulfide reductase n=1 Tax=Nonlabens antarcticus TaxID=392714 RepID=UPI0018917A50|nr:hypothetical protein [Nonlabens antarcticus]